MRFCSEGVRPAPVNGKPNRYILSSVRFRARSEVFNMNRKILSAVTLSLMLLNATGFAVGKTDTKMPPQNSLVAHLPDSDAVVIVDSRRFFDEAPRILASRPSLLTSIDGFIADIQKKS